MIAPILRGTVIGSAVGILPGSGSILGSFAAYSIEKKVSKNSGQFGKGAIEGVAAPEAANNAGAQTSFIPMLTLGIPSNPVMALMVGAMIIQGIQPGPSVIKEQPALFWGIIVSMWIGNLFLIILNLPLIGLWVRIDHGALPPALPVDSGLLRHRRLQPEQQRVRYPSHGAVRCARVRLRQSSAASRRRCCSPSSSGPLMEEYLRRALLLSRGDPWVFVQRPISATLLALAVLGDVHRADSGLQQDA